MARFSSSITVHRGTIEDVLTYAVAFTRTAFEPITNSTTDDVVGAFASGYIVYTSLIGKMI